ncbi:hypothetical protein Tco_0615269 [Tanacetum coccineum]
MSSSNEPVSSRELPSYDFHSTQTSLPVSPYRGHRFAWSDDDDLDDDHHDDHEIVQNEVQVGLAHGIVPGEPTKNVLVLANLEPVPDSPPLSPSYVADSDSNEEPMQDSDPEEREKTDSKENPSEDPSQDSEPSKDDELDPTTPSPPNTIIPFLYVGRCTARMSVLPVSTPHSVGILAAIAAFPTSSPIPLPVSPPSSPLSQPLPSPFRDPILEADVPPQKIALLIRFEVGESSTAANARLLIAPEMRDHMVHHRSQLGTALEQLYMLPTDVIERMDDQDRTYILAACICALEHNVGRDLQVAPPNKGSSC